MYNVDDPPWQPLQFDLYFARPSGPWSCLSIELHNCTPTPIHKTPVHLSLTLTLSLSHWAAGSRRWFVRLRCVGLSPFRRYFLIINHETFSFGELRQKQVNMRRIEGAKARCPPENFLWFYWLKFFSLYWHWLVFQVDSGPNLTKELALYLMM